MKWIKNDIGRLSGYSCCLLCKDTWNWKKPKNIIYEGNTSVFALCKECFDKLTVKQVIFWYDGLLNEDIRESSIDYTEKRIKKIRKTLRDNINKEKRNSQSNYWCKKMKNKYDGVIMNRNLPDLRRVDRYLDVITKDINKKRLHLGCGDNYRRGWVNLDNNSNYRVDIRHDLNVLPYPFKDNTFDFIYAQDLIEHIFDLLLFLNELHRISKPNAEICFQTGFMHSRNITIDFTHCHQFAIGSFNRVCDNVEGRGYIRGKFDLIEETPVVGGVGKLMPDFLRKKLWSIIGEVYEILIIRLKVKKEQ